MQFCKFYVLSCINFAKGTLFLTNLIPTFPILISIILPISNVNVTLSLPLLVKTVFCKLPKTKDVCVCYIVFFEKAYLISEYNFIII